MNKRRQPWRQAQDEIPRGPIDRTQHAQATVRLRDAGGNRRTRDIWWRNPVAWWRLSVPAFRVARARRNLLRRLGGAGSTAVPLVDTVGVTARPRRPRASARPRLRPDTRRSGTTAPSVTRTTAIDLAISPSSAGSTGDRSSDVALPAPTFHFPSAATAAPESWWSRGQHGEVEAGAGESVLKARVTRRGTE